MVIILHQRVHTRTPYGSFLWFCCLHCNHQEKLQSIFCYISVYQVTVPPLIAEEYKEKQKKYWPFICRISFFPYPPQFCAPQTPQTANLSQRNEPHSCMYIIAKGRKIYFLPCDIFCDMRFSEKKHNMRVHLYHVVLFLVPKMRLERTRPDGQGILSPWCLPFHHFGSDSHGHYTMPGAKIQSCARVKKRPGIRPASAKDCVRSVTCRSSGVPAARSSS